MQLRTIDGKVEEIAQAISQNVRMYCGKGQYDAFPDCQDAYLDGVETAIAMMYIDLTGGTKSQGVLRTLITDERDEAVAEERARWIDLVGEKIDKNTRDLMMAAFNEGVQVTRKGYERAIEDALGQV